MLGVSKKLFSLDSDSQNDIRFALLNYLRDLEKLESKLWGVKIVHLSSGEEEVLEDVNHLIHLLGSKKETEFKEVLEMKDTKDLFRALKELRKDFLVLKRAIQERNKLKNMITRFTIKQVNHKNYRELEDIFILEKQLYEVLDRQDEEFKELFKDMSVFKTIEGAEKTEVFLIAIKKIRGILSGHMDFHNLWEEERFEFSNISNILHSLISIVKKTLGNLEEKEFNLESASK